jgi:ABC-type branched-subunit amino acid transport system substrate-binding protein
MVDACTLARAASSFSVVGMAPIAQLTFVSRLNTIGQSFVHFKRFSTSGPLKGEVSSMGTRLRAAVVTALGLTIAACGGASNNNTAPAAPITIGVSISQSGDFSGDGKALKQGYDLWAQDVNKAGGLDGHQVTMKYVDDASSTEQVVTNYQNLITVDKVALVFGPFSSLLTIPASTVVARYGYAFPNRPAAAPMFSTGA